MIDASPSFEAARGISGRDLVAYLDEEGWMAAPSKVKGIMLFSKAIADTNQRAEFIVPIKPGFSDEQRRVADALRTISQMEGCTEAQIAAQIEEVVNKRKSKYKEALFASRNTAETPSELVAKSFSTSVNVLASTEIESAAGYFRKALGLADDQNVQNIVDLLENQMPKAISQFQLEVLPESESFAAYSTSAPPRIYVTASICRLASEGDGRSRYLLAHEMGHLWLQASAKSGKESTFATDSAEWQASLFAQAFLMPRRLALRLKNTEALSLYCKVEREVAETRLASLKKTEDERTGMISGFRQLISIFKRAPDAS
jgi:Zn-dependent peptidase ImmA (M78 family)